MSTHQAVDALHDLCSALGIDLSGMADDVLEVIALRIVAEDVLPTKPNIERIVAEVKRAEGSGQATALAQEPALPSAPRKPRYMATEAKVRQRLATVHRIEDGRTGLHLRPRRPDPIPALVAHPACLAAVADKGNPCDRCSWLLGEDVPYMDAHLDDEAY